jgi:hypothetical protein
VFLIILYVQTIYAKIETRAAPSNPRATEYDNRSSKRENSLAFTGELAQQAGEHVTNGRLS